MRFDRTYSTVFTVVCLSAVIMFSLPVQLSFLRRRREGQRDDLQDVQASVRAERRRLRRLWSSLSQVHRVKRRPHLHPMQE